MRTVFIWVSLLTLPHATLAQSRLLMQEVDKAVAKGVDIVGRHQQQDGSWRHGGHAVGISSLMALAMLESGVAPGDGHITKAYEFVRARAPYELQTYDISLAILFLDRHKTRNPEAAAVNEPLIRRLASRLEAGQLPSGGWTYRCPETYSDREDPGARISNRNNRRKTNRNGLIRGIVRLTGNFGDNSNTQFAVLGVWTAARSGFNASPAMALIEQRFRETQGPRGGWGYRKGGDTPSMTCAGLMSLVLAKGYRTIHPPQARMSNKATGGSKPGQAPAQMDSDPAIERGLSRLTAYAGMVQRGPLYFMWSLERVAVALKIRRIGKVDWYEVGAAALVRNQRSDGSWRSQHGELPDTAFALLFLKRANFTSDVPKLLTNQGGNRNRVRPGSIEQLRESLKKPANK